MIKENRNHTNSVTAYVGLGASLGDRQETLPTALRLLDELPEVRLKDSIRRAATSYYGTRAKE